MGRDSDLGAEPERRLTGFADWKRWSRSGGEKPAARGRRRVSRQDGAALRCDQGCLWGLGSDAICCADSGIGVDQAGGGAEPDRSC